MELTKDIISPFAYYFEVIWNRIVLFFGAEHELTHVFKIALIVQVLFLIVSCFRPSRWKWIVLYVLEAIFIIGSMVLLNWGYQEDRAVWLVYGGVSAVLFFLLLWITFACHLNATLPKANESTDKP